MDIFNSSKINQCTLPLPSKLDFHDLTPNKSVPPEAKVLLWLGGKFVCTLHLPQGILDPHCFISNMLCALRSSLVVMNHKNFNISHENCMSIRNGLQTSVTYQWANWSGSSTMLALLQAMMSIQRPIPFPTTLHSFPQKAPRPPFSQNQQATGTMCHYVQSICWRCHPPSDGFKHLHLSLPRDCICWNEVGEDLNQFMVHPPPLHHWETSNTIHLPPHGPKLGAPL